MSVIDFSVPQVMVDIETFGRTADACILAIGACSFNETDLLDQFYININIQSNIDAGRKIEGSTLAWWLEQNPVALAMLQEDQQSLEFALRHFAGWLRSDSCIWGNGADFDNALLANAYTGLNIELPWNFRSNRCYRTMKNLDHCVPTFVREGTYHNALDDAIFQAKNLQRINAALT